MSKVHSMQIKFQLVEVSMPLIKHCRARSPPGIPLHPIPPGLHRDKLEAKVNKSKDEAIALLRSHRVGTTFEQKMQDVFPDENVDLIKELHEAGVVPGGTAVIASAALLAFRLWRSVFRDDVTVDMVWWSQPLGL